MLPWSGKCRPDFGTHYVAQSPRIDSPEGVLRNHQTIGQSDDARAEGGVLIRVGDLHHGDAVVLIELAKKLHDFAALVGVEIPGRFIGQNDPWFCDEGAGNADELLLSARELTWLEILFPDDTEAIEHITNDGIAFPFRSVAAGQRHFDVFVDGQVVEEMVALEHEADVLLLQRETTFLVEFVDGIVVEPVFTGPSGIMESENM